MDKKMTPGMLVSRFFIFLLLIFLAFICLMPFYWMAIMGTLKNGNMYSDIPLLPGDQIIENYKLILQQVPFWRVAANTLIIAVSSTILTTFFSALAGYTFAKHQFPLREKLFAFVMATMMIPGQLTLVGLVQEMKAFGMLDTFFPLILPSIANAFGVFLMRQYMVEAIHNDLLDSARIDGCSEFRIFIQIVFPIITPVVASLAILSFLGSWNAFIGPLVLLYSPEKQTLTLAIQGLKGQYSGNFPVTFLGLFLSMLPILITYLSMSRYFIAGLTAGAVKG